MKERVTRVRVLAAALLLGLAACGGGSADPAGSGTAAPDASAPASDATLPDKSGGDTAERLTIRFVSENSNPGAEGAALDEFVRLVDEISAGAIHIQVLPSGRLPSEVWDAQRGPDAHTQAVINGKADMGLIGNNYWGYEGVTSTQALQLPLLMRSAAQAVAVAEDSELVQQVFAGLDDVGVVGLQLIPQNFKVLVGFDGTIAGPADVAGTVLESRAAPELFSFYEALGARPQQDVVGRQTYVAPPWLQADWDQGDAIGNLPIYFVYFDLVANRSFWNGLTDEQRSVLSDAAAKTEEFVLGHLPEDHSAADLAAYCGRGSSVSHLAPSAVDAFRAVAQPIVDQMADDPAVASIIDRIATLGQGATPTVYPECGPPTSNPDASLPPGTYRFEITEDDLRRAGIQEDQWEFDVGVYTVRLANGSFTWTQQSPTKPAVTPGKGSYEGGGRYTVSGDRVVFVEESFDEPVTSTLTFAVGAAGSLRFTIVEATRDFAKFLYGEPWVRIGDA